MEMKILMTGQGMQDHHQNSRSEKMKDFHGERATAKLGKVSFHSGVGNSPISKWARGGQGKDKSNEEPSSFHHNQATSRIPQACQFLSLIYQRLCHNL